jgi:ABC-type Mn2+/Zn2+ transport system ATPase subunit
MQFVIDTHNLSKTFRRVDALKALNLSVPQHSIFGFLGPNGAGKTTTIKLLLGLIRPTAGSASIFGLDSVRDSVAIRARIGYLPQEPRFYEYMSARQILDYTAHFFFKGPQQAIEERIAETLKLVGLEDKADRPIKGFSGGKRQRLGIAQAQVNYPDLLILDEPPASLDPMGRRACSFSFGVLDAPILHGGAQGQHPVCQRKVHLAQVIAPVHQGLVGGLAAGDVTTAVEAGFGAQNAGSLVMEFLGAGQFGVEIGQGLDQIVDVDAVGLSLGDQVLGLGCHLGGTRQVKLLALQDVLFALQGEFHVLTGALPGLRVGGSGDNPGRLGPGERGEGS